MPTSKEIGDILREAGVPAVYKMKKAERFAKFEEIFGKKPEAKFDVSNKKADEPEKSEPTVETEQSDNGSAFVQPNTEEKAPVEKKKRSVANNKWNNYLSAYRKINGSKHIMTEAKEGYYKWKEAGCPEDMGIVKREQEEKE